MTQKLVVCYIGQNCKDWLELSIKSVREEADSIVFIDGGGNPLTIPMTEEHTMLTEKYNFKQRNKDDILNDGNRDCNHYIGRLYEHGHKGANGRARNCYLKFIQNNFPDYWCLVLDPDEVVDDIKKLKEDIQTLKPGLYSPKMRHLVGSLAQEDDTRPEHFCINRFFKNHQDLSYPEREHTILCLRVNNEDKTLSTTRYYGITIWHFSLAKQVMQYYKKYKSDSVKSQVHSGSFLRDWYLKVIFGTYPKKLFDINDLPPVVLKHFMIDNVAEELYFKKRGGVNIYHWMEPLEWIKEFHPKNVLYLGCGMGSRVFTTNHLGVDAEGIEKNKWAIDNLPFTVNRDKVHHQDILSMKLDKTFDLVVGYDVLEHIEEKDIDKALNNILNVGNKHYLFSIPFLGDPNLEVDKTHKIKKSREWWEKLLNSKGLKVIDTPEPFRHPAQLIVCEKK